MILESKLITRRIGRKKPYTVEAIRKARCVGCGDGARHQWNCCANDNRWMPVCIPCDVALNEMTLAFFRVPGRASLLSRYRKRQARQ